MGADISLLKVGPLLGPERQTAFPNSFASTTHVGVSPSWWFSTTAYTKPTHVSLYVRVHDQGVPVMRAADNKEDTGK